MTVEKIMSKTVVTVEMDDSLRVVKTIFDNTRFHHLLVVEAGRLVGVISDRDLLKAVSPNIGTPGESAKDAASLNKKVHQIMTRKPVMIRQNAGIFEAIEIFNKAIKIRPSSGDAYFNRGISKINSGDVSGACADWQQAKKSGNNYASSFINKHCR